MLLSFAIWCVCMVCMLLHVVDVIAILHVHRAMLPHDFTDARS
jgi:hypothetical protein